MKKLILVVILGAAQLWAATERAVGEESIQKTLVDREAFNVTTGAEGHPLNAKSYGKKGADEFRLLVLGNSITYHAPLAAVSWPNAWGMAASAADKDYVSVLVRKLSGRMPDRKVVPYIINVATFERGFFEMKVADYFAKAAAFNPDAVTMLFSGNCRFGDPKFPASTPEAFERAMSEVIEFLRARNPSARFYLGNSFFTDKTREGIWARLAAKHGARLVDTQSVSSVPENLARSEREYAHPGVGAHPGDRGMARLAELFFDSMKHDTETDWAAINRESAEMAVREWVCPGKDGKPFWNGSARQYIHPPAFELKDVPGAAKYRYTLKDDAGTVLGTFEAESPRAALTPVWGQVPPGTVRFRPGSSRVWT